MKVNYKWMDPVDHMSQGSALSSRGSFFQMEKEDFGSS